MKKVVREHISTRLLTETMIIPEHDERKESPEFGKSKRQLKRDGHFQCWVCGSTKNLQVHHFLYEWCIKDTCDFKKLKEVSETLDVYGYGEQMKDIPITSVDDIRNMMVICREHHVGGLTDGASNGIHNMSFPAWVCQKIAKDGQDPIPDNRLEIELAQDRIENRDNHKGD